MAIIISHSHIVHVAFLSTMVFQIWLNGILTFLGTRWYVVSVQDPQMVCDQKKFENQCYKVSNTSGTDLHIYIYVRNCAQVTGSRIYTFLMKILVLCLWEPKQCAIFVAQLFLETRLSSESLDPMIGFPAYLEPKLWLTNQKLDIN